MMKVNIWSDIRCPFCYIGKKKFELALEKFQHQGKIEVNWRSFELDANLVTDTSRSMYDYIADIKGISLEQASQMHHQVTQAADSVGLTFDFDKAVLANSFNAHRLIQFAKTKDLGNEAEELLFKAHLTEGKNIDDRQILLAIGLELGLSEEELKDVIFNANAYAKEVKLDQQQAQAIGVRGVPFFVFNDKYAVSGAQSPDTFLEVLEKSWEEYASSLPNELVVLNSENSCDIDGKCS
jgi:predicted DsbA family dithiol-disulfide isomerase